jgi:hypothetical protein
MININYLAYRRDIRYIDLTFHFLSKIKEENKEKIVVSLLIDSNHEQWAQIRDILLYQGLDVRIHNFERHDGYIKKVRWAADQDFEYSVKLDEDIFINNHVWDYIIENVDVLEDSKNFMLTCQLSNGIPTCDMFMEDFFSEEQIAEMQTAFKQVSFGEWWEKDYSALDKFTPGS